MANAAMMETSLDVISHDDCISSSSHHNYSTSSGNSSCNTSDLNEISVDYGDATAVGLKYLPKWPPVDIEFHDLTYTVPDLTTGNKVILKNIHGQFRSHELTAIMGPSGSGKTTLLNTLAGYDASRAAGLITVNSQPRNTKVFRKMSRYIMQNEVLDPLFSVREAMMIAAHLKLGNELTLQQKNEIIDEILNMLRLKNSENTYGQRLSGGEKKRLSVALELVNNPPVIFLDEPTTGLDDISSSQCIALLRRIAHTGRTVICSIHTPSAKLFQMFDNVYVVAEGQCVYQGSGDLIVRYMETVGLSCPLTYNPADFIIEVAAREYGSEYLEKMNTSVENGKVLKWRPPCDECNNKYSAITTDPKYPIDQFMEEINPKLLKSKASWSMQFRILFSRMVTQMWRDRSYIRLKFCMTIILGFIVGAIFTGVGNDATKALFNFGFAITIMIAYLYMPMMPILLQFPTEIHLLKREYFNQWYRLTPYYFAMICAKLPIMFALAVIYISMIYLISSQPLEWSRFLMVFLVSILVGMISDSLGVLISARLSIVNSMFVGPVAAVPMILLSIYGIGYGEGGISPFMRFVMAFSYLRHGIEGIVAALYGNNRSDTICPETEMFCMFRKSQFLLGVLGFQDLNYVLSIFFLVAFYIFFTVAAFLMIKQRLSFNRSNLVAVQYIGQFVKNHFNFSGYKY